MHDNREWTDRLQAVMPWGSSTCSKAPHLLPEEPGAIVRGEGCRVWDADGREFIDFRNGLGPVTLGYRFPAVDAALRTQIDSGILFGHPHPLEAEVAEMLRDVIPCAEQVRFLKTGGEALAACIRLARFHTGREHVVQIGYNGWLNSLAAGGRLLPGQNAEAGPPGVPASLSALHHACAWNDREALEHLFARHTDQIAAVVVAADYAGIATGESFYPFLRELTERHGSLLIFDEIVTGFRIALGGVQERFAVLPDLAVFSKGLANGMPLSAYMGKRAILQKLQKVIVSSTFGGETLSLAAARATIETYRRHDVIQHLWRQGEKLWTGLNCLFAGNNLPAQVRGYWPCPQISFTGADAAGMSQRFFRAAYRNGVSLYTVSYVNFSHHDADIAEALERLEAACRETARDH